MMASDKAKACVRIQMQQHTVLVDAEDYALISRYPWVTSKKANGMYYVEATIYHNGKKSKIFLHRLVMGMQQLEIDHRNRNGLDNRKCNLRYCTKRLNAANSKRVNKFGYKGIWRYPKSVNFVARINKGKKRVEYGPFKTAKAAALAYDKLALQLYGEFAALNFPGEA